jgi:lambda family phage minor tail protein L
MAINSTLQELSPGGEVQLWTLDATVLGGGIYYFSQTKRPGSAGVTMGGQLFTGVPLEAAGFDWSTAAQAQRPSLKVPSFVALATTNARQYGWFIGATVTRQLTYERHLDDGSDPDTTAIYRADVYTVARRSKHTIFEMEWELRAVTDITHREIPARRVLPNTCSRTYRRPDGLGGFDYTNVTCPWGVDDPDGGDYYDIENSATTAGNDACRKTLAACKVRYADNSLPFYGMPGVGNIRAS